MREQNNVLGSWPEWFISAHQVAEDHPMRKAIFLLLNNAANCDAMEVSQKGLNDGDRHYHAGRLAAIKDLHDEWENLFKAANKTVDKDG